MQQSITQNKQSPKQSSHVRFTKEEYIQIKNDSERTGISIPDLLKHAYLKGPIPMPIFDIDVGQSVYSELRKIGINVNQIAKQLNSGFKMGSNYSFEEFYKVFHELLTTIRRNLGCNQN